MRATSSCPQPRWRARLEFRRDLRREQLERGERFLRPIPWRIMHHDRGCARTLAQMRDLVGDRCGRAVQDDIARERVIAGAAADGLFLNRAEIPRGLPAREM